MTFNPFDKSINELEAADLSELVRKQVAEGYYVEYKGAIFPENRKIARSIASLANSFGGWYFLGIETDAANIAIEVVGFDLAIYNDPIAKIREVVKSYIDPVPRFFIQQIALDDPSKAVLAVYVPAEQDTPFVTSDGRIYRRTHDSSDPIPEANRYAIDKLTQDGEKTRKAFGKFCEDERTFSKSEAENKNIGWLNIFIKPYLLSPIADLGGKKSMQSLLERSRTQFDIALTYDEINMTGNLPFNSIYQTQKSVVMRQADPYYSAFQALTVEFFYDGRAKFHIPISFLNVYPDSINEEDLKANGFTANAVVQFFQEISNDDHQNAGFQFLRFFDAGALSGVITTLSTFYLDWLKYDNGLVTDLRIALSVDGGWRAVPFFDDDEWVAYVREFGIPIGKTDTIVFPEDISTGLKIDANPKHNLGLMLSEATGLMFGFPFEYNQIAFGHYMQKRFNAAQEDRNRQKQGKDEA